MEKYKNIRALIVDDDESISAMVRLCLSGIGVSDITVAGDGIEALNHFTPGSTPFGLIICDLMMPRMDGIEFLKRVRSTNRDVPFLMLTAKKDQKEYFDAKAAGATYYFMKPFTVDDLQMRVKAALDAS